jgi:hypothetical protein
MVFCDTADSVLEWSSEEIVVPYISPVDGMPHRYFVDFWIKTKTPEGIVCKLVEIKPEKQSIQPVPPAKGVSRRYINEVKTYAINKSKWDAASEFCKKRNWEFVVLTEKHLFTKKYGS